MIEKIHPQLKKDFPATERKVNDLPLIYLDSAASTLKARPVVEALFEHELYAASNVHRSHHYLGIKATESYEGVREKVKNFIGANSSDEIIFTKGTTESVNLLASSLEDWFEEGDEILLTEMEHHANLIPWQRLAAKKGVKLQFIPVDARGNLMLDSLGSVLNEKTKLMSVTHISNSLGTINDIDLLSKVCKRHKVLFAVDAAQSVSFQKLDVQTSEIDFLFFSGHKMWAPYGVGVFYGKKEHLEKMSPYQTGGSMIKEVGYYHTTFSEPPTVFEAGTPPVSQVVALGRAIDYIDFLGIDLICESEKKITQYAVEKLKELDFIELVGTPINRANIISFLVKDHHPFDVASLLNEYGVAVRAGHHCNQPLMKKWDISGTVRVSFSIYNYIEDVDKLIYYLKKVEGILNGKG